MHRAESSTSLERTYRYLRIGIAGVAVVIFIAVAIASAQVGWLMSVSDYYFTPARDAFVGALIAASLALLALSGRGLERGLLDAAALFAPLIALVPTTLAPGAVPGVEVTCAFRCFPPEYEADAANGVLTYLAVGAVIVAVTLLLVALRQVSFAAVGLSLALAASVLVAVALTWFLARDAFLAQGHFVATIGFFALFAAVAVLAAFPRGRDAPPTVYRVLYTVIAALLVVVLVAYGVLSAVGDDGIPTVLIVESGALVLFSAFWVVQGVEKWDAVDPAVR
ncbi:hypothetical protein QL996_11265 [Planococcus sp. APC 4015]|nr:hypothetical protein [Planococcus sp. APC 4015]